MYWPYDYYNDTPFNTTNGFSYVNWCAPLPQERLPACLLPYRPTCAWSLQALNMLRCTTMQKVCFMYPCVFGSAAYKPARDPNMAAAQGLRTVG